MPSVLRLSVLFVKSLRRDVALAHVCASGVLFAMEIRAGVVPAWIMLSLLSLYSAKQLSKYKPPEEHMKRRVIVAIVIEGYKV